MQKLKDEILREFDKFCKEDCTNLCDCDTWFGNKRVTDVRKQIKQFISTAMDKTYNQAVQELNNKLKKYGGRMSKVACRKEAARCPLSVWHE